MPGLRKLGWFGGLCLCAASAGCGSDVAVAGSASPGTGGASGSAGGGGAGTEPVALPEQLRFGPSEVLRLEPGMHQQLEVFATPAGVYDISVSLVGDARDAALDTSKVRTAPSGRAVIGLIAPTAPTTFQVRASVGGKISRRAAVSVASGFVDLRVAPKYAGVRSVKTWTATARAGSCADLEGHPPPDGDLVATAKPGNPVVIDDVPIGTPLAITLRAAFFAGGCTDVSGAELFDAETVTVKITDKPIQLEGVELDLVLGTTPDARALVDALLGHVEPMVLALDAGDRDDVELLLDTMRATADSDQRSAFAAARSLEQWDAALRDAWGPAPGTLLRDSLRKWLRLGAERFAGPKLFEGVLTSSSAEVGDTRVLLERVAGLPVAEAGFVSESSGSFSADTGDTLLLGTSFHWLPSGLLAALAKAPAQIDVPDAETPDAALAQILKCPALATALSELGADAELAFDTCGSDCLEALCETALETLWEQVAASSSMDSEPASLAVSASGGAEIDDHANPIGLQGTWVGTHRSEYVEVSVAGAVSASAPE